ncbi:MAG: hypothetical protein O7B30_05705 [Thaumarchaeota archaeon]|nr:hypothetical protein [Nitrososphaerota archaeon]
MAKGWISGIYPRSERLIEATRRQDPKLSRLFEEEKRKIIRQEFDAGLDFMTDPLIDWDDILRPFTENLGGVEIGALDRFYENNTFYRRPLVLSEVKSRGHILSSAISNTLFPKKKAWKVDLLDPYSMADLSENRYYRSKEELMFAYSKVLAKELRGLPSNLALVQFNAPSLARTKDKDTISQAKEAIRMATRGIEATKCLHLYFGNISSTLPQFLDFGVDILGIDFINSDLQSFQGTTFTKALACGCVDAQNTRIERPSEIVAFVTRVVNVLNPKSISVIPNTDLEFIPQPFARKKVQAIGKAITKLGDEGI